MRKNEFKVWMESLGTMKTRPIGDAISRCKRVENSLNINLDNEFEKDRGNNILTLLEYTKEDEQLNCSPPEGIVFVSGSNIKNGMASLKSAVKKYFEFCHSKN